MDEWRDQEERVVDALDALALLMDISSSYVLNGALVVTGVSLINGRRVTLYLPLPTPGADLWTDGQPAQC